MNGFQIQACVGPNEVQTVHTLSLPSSSTSAPLYESAVSHSLPLIPI